MAIETSCQTSGVVFNTNIEPNALRITVFYGRTIEMTADEVEVLEANIHNALELVLKPYYYEK